MLILLGTFLRGPNWNFFGPYEYWDLHKLIPLNNVNLSEIFWIELLGKSKPTNPLYRELPGILLCLGYFMVDALPDVSPVLQAICRSRRAWCAT